MTRYMIKIKNIVFILGVLSENGQGDLVDWLQGSLLDAWRVKVGLGTGFHSGG